MPSARDKTPARDDSAARRAMSLSTWFAVGTGVLGVVLITWPDLLTVGAPWVQLALGCSGQGREVLYRRVRGRDDHCGDRNHWASVNDLMAPDRFAARLLRDLRLTPPVEQPMRLFA